MNRRSALLAIPTLASGLLVTPEAAACWWKRRRTGFCGLSHQSPGAGVFLPPTEIATITNRSGQDFDTRSYTMIEFHDYYTAPSMGHRITGDQVTPGVWPTDSNLPPFDLRPERMQVNRVELYRGGAQFVSDGSNVASPGYYFKSIAVSIVIYPFDGLGLWGVRVSGIQVPYLPG